MVWSGDNQPLLAVKKSMHSQVVGTQKLWARAKEPPGETFITQYFISLRSKIW